MNEVLSISIVAYRNYDEIITALETLYKYIDPLLSKKIYIIDNSSDVQSKSDEFQKNILDIDNRIEYISTRANVGYGTGHNYIIGKLQSSYHCIMNPDIIFFEDAFTPIISYMESNIDVGMVIPQILDEAGNRQDVYRKELTVYDMFIRMFIKKGFEKRKKAHSLQDMDYSKPFQVPFGQGSFLVIRTELFKELKGFDDRFFMYMEDADLCKRVNEQSKLMYYPDAKVIHRWDRGSHKDYNLFKIHIQSMCKYFNKWGWRIK